MPQTGPKTVNRVFTTSQIAMNSIVAFFACLAVANAGVVVAPSSAKIIQGPSTRTTVVGPDGSSISSVAPGGTIVQEHTGAVVADSALPVAPVAYSAAPVAYSAPIAYSAHAAPYLAYSAPLAYGAPFLSHYSAAPLAYSAGLVAEKQLDTVVAGPSGTIATSKTVHRPALVAAPQAYAAGVHAYYL